jgi:cysteine desulfurase / selenocysteine lyase
MSDGLRQEDVSRLRQDFPMLAVDGGGHPLIYLDNAASTQKPQAVIDRMLRFYTHEYAKNEEEHRLSRQATGAIEDARAKAAEFLNASMSVVRTLGAKCGAD